MAASAETLNSFFTEIVVKLKLSEYKGLSTPLDDNQHLILNIKLFLVIHLSSKKWAGMEFSKKLKILIHLQGRRNGFQNGDHPHRPQPPCRRPWSKETQESDIPTKIVKENAEIFADFLHLVNALKVE